MSNDLEKRVQILEDIEAIKKLKTLYCRYADDNYNPEKLGALYTEDAVWDGGAEWGVYHGKKAIKEHLKKLPETILWAVHYVIAPHIEVKGDKAYGGWYSLGFGVLRKNNQAYYTSSFYNDEYTKIDGKWFISKVQIERFFLSPYEEGWGKNRYFKPMG